MVAQPQPIRLPTGDSKVVIWVRPTINGALVPEAFTWRDRKYQPVDDPTWLVDFYFKGPERHARLRVKGLRKPRVMLCGRSDAGLQSGATLPDQEDEGTRLLTVCRQCNELMDAMVLPERNEQ